MAAASQLLSELARAFPRHPVTRETLDVYLRELADLPVDVLERAVRELIRTSEWFPTVRAIRESASEHALGLPGEADALAQVEARQAWGRQDEQTRGTPPALHPLVAEALDHVGGWHAFRTADEPAVVRGQFGRLFRELRSAALREAQIGDLAALPAASQRKELGA
jgi:hypothetical protein